MFLFFVRIIVLIKKLLMEPLDETTAFVQWHNV